MRLKGEGADWVVDYSTRTGSSIRRFERLVGEDVVLFRGRPFNRGNFPQELIDCL